MQNEIHRYFSEFKGINRIPATLFIAAVVLLSLTACGSGFKIGDFGSVNKATELAVDCKTDEALEAVKHAEQGGGLGASMAELERVAILREAGRLAEADKALAERNKRWNVNAKDAANAEKAVDEVVENIRVERQKKTGSRTCK